MFTKTEYSPLRDLFRNDHALTVNYLIGDTMDCLGCLIIGIYFFAVLRKGKKMEYVRIYILAGFYFLNFAALHFLNIISLWRGYYWLIAFAKDFSGIMSFGVCVFLPKILIEILQQRRMWELKEELSATRKKLEDIQAINEKANK